MLHPLIGLHNGRNCRYSTAYRLGLLLPAVLVFAFLTMATVPRQAKAEEELLSGKPFREALQQPVSIAWSRRPLAEGIRQLSESRQVAILIDRNLDPGQLVTLTAKNIPFGDAVRAIAVQCRAGTSVIGNCLYIGPESTTNRLRTVVELLSNELTDDLGQGTSRRGLDLVRRRTQSWDDLATPREVLDEIGKTFKLKIIGIEQIQHDLWAGASIPALNAVEQLTLVLAQFELSFTFDASLDGIRLKPMPDDPVMNRSWSLRTASLRRRAADAIKRWPAVTAELKGSQLSASGTFEQLEQFDRVLYPQRYSTQTRPRSTTGDLRFTARLRGTVLALIKGIDARSDLRFEFDEEALKAAGIQLDRQIDTELKNASVEELCRTLFDQSGIAYEIQERTVRLKPDA